MPYSVIHGMLYSPQNRTLDIVFRDGRGAYRYFEVDGVEWAAFRRAASKGTHLNHVFKAKHPRFERVDASFESAQGLHAPMRVHTSPRDVPDQNVWGFYET